jgi:uncharacterized protein YhbP (UPF0306 family)
MPANIAWDAKSRDEGREFSHETPAGGGSGNFVMNREEKLEWARTLLAEVSTLTICSVDEAGMPASAPLFFLADNDLTLYWLSDAQSQHSRNLVCRSQAAVSVYRSTHDWKQIRGLQMRGSAAAVEDAARRKAIQALYCERFQLGRIFELALLKSTLYSFRPTHLHAVDNTRHFGWKFDLDL